MVISPIISLQVLLGIDFYSLFSLPCRNHHYRQPCKTHQSRGCQMFQINIFQVHRYPWPAKSLQMQTDNFACSTCNRHSKLVEIEFEN